MDSIRLHPMAGRDAITEDTIIARIQNPPSESRDLEKVGSSHSFGCRVKIEDPEKPEDKAFWYPDRKIGDAKNLELTFGLESAEGCAPRLRLTQNLRRKNEAVDGGGNQIPAHHGSIDLAFGRVYRSIDDTSEAPNQVFNLQVDYNERHHTARISFDSTGATANNLKCLIDFPNGHDRVRNIQICGYEREMTTKLCNLASIPEGKTLHVTLLLRPGENDREAHLRGHRNAIDEMLDSLPFEGNVCGLLKTNMTLLSYYQMRDLTHKPIADPAQMAKPSRIYDANHSCLPEPPRTAWQDADEALIRLTTSVHLQHLEASVVSASLEKKKAEDFASLTSPVILSNAAVRPPASLTSKVDDKSYAAMINAVAVTYGRESWVTKKWSALLNDGGFLPAGDLIASVTCSHEQWNKALKTLNNAHGWDKTQRAHIDAFLKAPGGMALLTGSIGTGKTEVMIHLFWFCLQVGIKVIVTGTKHAALDLIITKFLAKFPSAEPPLRVYAYVTLSPEVIRRTKMIVGDLVAIGSKEISENFSQDTPIARFDDDAQASPEQPSLIGIASCHYSKNICVWAMYGDSRQTGVSNPTGRHAENIVDIFYKQSDMSLFRRLCLAGHPVIRLTVQWRQHEKLFELLNELHYDMGTRTRGNKKADLQEHTTLMGRIVGSPYSKIAAQSDHQKRILHVVVNSPTMKAKDTKSRANPGFAAYVVDIVLPKVRGDFGTSTHENVILIVPYAKQKELYRRHFVKLRSQGWTDAELPQLCTVDASHGYEAHLVVFDIVNDDYEGFLQDKKRCCVAFSRAKEQMIVISGALARVDQITKTRVVRDATNQSKMKTITLQCPLLHWTNWFASMDCRHTTAPPKFEIPTDLCFYDEE